jgi:hypothetical protein
MSSPESLIAGAFKISPSCLRLVALDNRRGDGGFGDQPGKCDLGRNRRMACRYLVECAQDGHATRVKITLEPSCASGVAGAFFRRSIFSCQESGGERIIVDDAQLLLPADRLELGFELLAVGKIIEWLQALVARQAEFPARLE